MLHFDDRNAVRIRFGAWADAAMTHTRAGGEGLDAKPPPFDDDMAAGALVRDVMRRERGATAALDRRTPRVVATRPSRGDVTSRGVTETVTTTPDVARRMQAASRAQQTNLRLRRKRVTGGPGRAAPLESNASRRASK
ncbi:hypothetical protein [Burkholderia oklahomensis]|uniref:hypothetical protein n=1 Tax=Burkholderia oklahomensis TaxID=342113 RepID=UPI00016A7FC8|nr:hypothetical protein [Burkholderia oklahomensis]AJX33878.1 hypothetical protein BG90_5783 [Burkholderia oklahomensis C6786]AOI49401.1 hypothetical protein WI23_26895 [Burkholderia oklahomensis C6786]KUY62320.1 hypothetical protein WI23_09710 [Burkholderia oklahomensis C6786]MBI0362345.1 hypothetical protein [Burkholderia oklahomensis]SUY26450.1 Uncharacterised protein [Burkholderia oklahomensis]